MSLENGSQLGVYKVIGPLGAGGMGEVYRATDTKLDREVAIKVLPESMAHDAERVARFEREAKVLGQLNHPMIAAIHGFDEANGKRFLVLELVEGPTLADRLKNGRLPVDECLDIGRQIAEALEVAHEKGIIHRDLKPANIKVTMDGEVKVLDFGLAKALAEEETNIDPSSSPTITENFTAPGMILGTAAYMSPEQARGRPVDKRSDIWSFGCVLYECLTGDSMFRGETVTDSIGAILHKQPDWDLLPAETPPTVHLLLRRCLAKDRKRRLRDIGDVRIELEAAIADPTSSALGLASAAIAAEGFSTLWNRRTLTAIASAVVLTALTAVGIGWSYWPDPPPPPLVVVTPPPPELPLRKLDVVIGSQQGGGRSWPAISPDGRKIAYCSEDTLWVRELDSSQPRELFAGEGVMHPFWSPGSDQVGFFYANQLLTIPIVGGREDLVTPLRQMPEVHQGGATWNTENQIIFSLARGGGGRELQNVSAGGGEPKILFEREEGERDFEKPSSLPGNRGVLFAFQAAGAETRTTENIGVFSSSGRKVIHRQEGETLRAPVFSPTGHVVYQRDSTNPGIWAFEFSLERLEKTGEPFKVAEGSMPSVANDGTLLFSSRMFFGTGDKHRLVRIDADGNVEPIGTKEQDMTLFGPFVADVSLSPDDGEDRVLVSAYEEETNTRAIWRHDLSSKRAVQVSFPPDGSRDALPVWHPDGERILFRRQTDDGDLIMIGPADGGGEPTELVAGTRFSVSSDGKYLAYDFGTRGKRDIGYISLEGEEEKQPKILRENPFREAAPSISPDVRLLAYFSNESGGDNEIYLTRFPSGKGRWQASRGGGVFTFWSKDPANQLLYYHNGDILYRVSVTFPEESAEPKIGDPEEVFDTQKLGLARVSRLGISRDGKQFIAVQFAHFGKEADGNTEVEKLIFVENWFSEFKDKVSKGDP